jgi:hypothetical protein
MSVYHRQDSVKGIRRTKSRAEAERSAASLAFVALAESGQLDDVTAAEHAALFEGWTFPKDYAPGQIRQHGGRLYRCIQAHASHEDWTPDSAASLWSAAGDPAAEWPDWSQPVGAHDAYDAGDKCAHGGKRWVSAVAGNVWEPGVYGWTEAAE